MKFFLLLYLHFVPHVMQVTSIKRFEISQVYRKATGPNAPEEYYQVIFIVSLIVSVVDKSTLNQCFSSIFIINCISLVSDHYNQGSISTRKLSIVSLLQGELRPRYVQVCHLFLSCSSDLFYPCLCGVKHQQFSIESSIHEG